MHRYRCYNYTITIRDDSHLYTVYENLNGLSPKPLDHKYEYNGTEVNGLIYFANAITLRSLQKKLPEAVIEPHILTGNTRKLTFLE